MPFLFYRTLTINHTLCGSSSSTGFPVLVSATDTTLKLVANGGRIQQTDGSDILFFADVTAATQYPSEVEFYDGVNGVLVAWVKIPTVSNTVDTTFYIMYDNVSPPSRTTNPWDTHFKGVWHLPNGTVLSGADSTTGAHTATPNAGVSAVAGQVDGGGSFNGTNGAATTATFVMFSASYSDLTFSAWTKISAANMAARRCVFSTTSTAAANNWWVEIGNAGAANSVSINYPFLFMNVAAYPTDGLWHHIAFERTGATVGTWYVDGVAEPVLVNQGNAAFADSGEAKTIGNLPIAGFFFPGQIDEVKASDTNRGADWALSEFNNQSSPGTIGTPGFLTWGAETVTTVSDGCGLLTILAGS